MTIIQNPSDKRVQAAFLRGHLRLVAAGMQSRVKKSDLLKKATSITGKPYKRGEYAKAADEITAWMDVGVAE